MLAQLLYRVARRPTHLHEIDSACVPINRLVEMLAHSRVVEQGFCSRWGLCYALEVCLHRRQNLRVVTQGMRSRAPRPAAPARPRPPLEQTMSKARSWRSRMTLAPWQGLFFLVVF